MRVLLTTTNFQDPPGEHHQILARSGFEVVRARGPLDEKVMLETVKSGGGFDGLLNGDDQITAKVIDAALPRLRVIAKYGIGLDSIDVKYATSKRIPVLFTPGVNHTTVAEHAIGLMISVAKAFPFHFSTVKSGQWKRQTGNELFGKTLGVLGLGRIGKELVIRCNAFGMKAIGYDLHWDESFARQYNVQRCDSAEDVLKQADVVSLHMNLTPEPRGLISAKPLPLMKDGAILINTARGGLVVEADIAEACRSGKLKGYATDVLEQEPIKPPHPFLELDNVVITPHIGSRTHESVQRQGMRAALNLVNFLNGDKDYVQANSF